MSPPTVVHRCAPTGGRAVTINGAIGGRAHDAAGGLTGDAPFDSGETTDGTDDGDGTGGQDDWYPQLDEAAPPIRSRRRLPRDLAAAIDSCLRPDPAARPTIPELAAAVDATPPWQRRHIAPSSVASRAQSSRVRSGRSRCQTG